MGRSLLLRLLGCILTIVIAVSGQPFLRDPLLSLRPGNVVVSNLKCFFHEVIEVDQLGDTLAELEVSCNMGGGNFTSDLLYRGDTESTGVGAYVTEVESYIEYDEEDSGLLVIRSTGSNLTLQYGNETFVTDWSVLYLTGFAYQNALKSGRSGRRLLGPLDYLGGLYDKWFGSEGDTDTSLSSDDKYLQNYFDKFSEGVACDDEFEETVVLRCNVQRTRTQGIKSSEIGYWQDLYARNQLFRQAASDCMKEMGASRDQYDTMFSGISGGGRSDGGTMGDGGRQDGVEMTAGEAIEYAKIPIWAACAVSKLGLASGEFSSTTQSAEKVREANLRLDGIDCVNEAKLAYVRCKGRRRVMEKHSYRVTFPRREKASPEPTKSPTRRPTRSPTRSPTISPTLTPSPTPSPVPCPCKDTTPGRNLLEGCSCPLPPPPGLAPPGLGASPTVPATCERSFNLAVNNSTLCDFDYYEACEFMFTNTSNKSSQDCRSCCARFFSKWARLFDWCRKQAEYRPTPGDSVEKQQLTYRQCVCNVFSPLYCVYAQQFNIGKLDDIALAYLTEPFCKFDIGGNPVEQCNVWPRY